MPSHRYHGISSHPHESTMTYSHCVLSLLPNPFLCAYLLSKRASGLSIVPKPWRNLLVDMSSRLSTLAIPAHFAQIWVLDSPRQTRFCLSGIQEMTIPCYLLADRGEGPPGSVLEAGRGVCFVHLIHCSVLMDRMCFPQSIDSTSDKRPLTNFVGYGFTSTVTVFPRSTVDGTDGVRFDSPLISRAEVFLFS